MGRMAIFTMTQKRGEFPELDEAKSCFFDLARLVTPEELQQVEGDASKTTNLWRIPERELTDPVMLKIKDLLNIAIQGISQIAYRMQRFVHKNELSGVGEYSEQDQFDELMAQLAQLCGALRFARWQIINVIKDDELTKATKAKRMTHILIAALVRGGQGYYCAKTYNELWLKGARTPPNGAKLPILVRAEILRLADLAQCPVPFELRVHHLTGRPKVSNNSEAAFRLLRWVVGAPDTEPARQGMEPLIITLIQKYNLKTKVDQAKTEGLEIRKQEKLRQAGRVERVDRGAL